MYVGKHCYMVSSNARVIMDGPLQTSRFGTDGQHATLDGSFAEEEVFAYNNTYGVLIIFVSLTI